MQLGKLVDGQTTLWSTMPKGVLVAMSHEYINHLLGHICLYAYMHKVNPNIFRYFLWFYSCITFIHCSHTVPIFPKFYSLQKPVTLTRHCWFLLPFKHPCSCASCGIKLYYTQCACSLRHAEQSWSRGRKQGICGLRHPLAFSLLSVLTVTEEVRTHCFFSFIVLINCIIVSTRYYQYISVLTVTEEFLFTKSSKF